MAGAIESIGKLLGHDYRRHVLHVTQVHHFVWINLLPMGCRRSR
jgi:hypothetical protein